MEKKNYLQSLILEGTHVNLFLKNGFKMTGLVITHESGEYFLVLDAKGKESLVYKSVISTVQKDPKVRINFHSKYETEGEKFVENIVSKQLIVRIFIANGYQFTGRILEDAGGEYFLVKDTTGVEAIVFKEHISTISVE